MININKYILIFLFLIFMSGILQAQEAIAIKGKVVNAETLKPVSGARIFSTEASSTAIANENGEFEIQVRSLDAVLQVNIEGFFDRQEPLLKRNLLTIYIYPSNSIFYQNDYRSAEGEMEISQKMGDAKSLNNRNLSKAYSAVDDALAGKIPGLRVINKSGMSGEGSLVNVRGIRSFIAENTPLIVVDGLPYLPDLRPSYTISGFSQNIFAPVNNKDIQSVTLLRGAEAAAYGSLGSNGVLEITTQKATNLETQVEIHTMQGVGFMKKRLPLMGAEAFKNYVADIGETEDSDLNSLIDKFPFLKEDPDDYYNYLYDNNTNWQKEIYTNSFISENLIRIMGGDAVATYALTAGYLYNGGIIENTQQQKYYTRLNSDINITQKLSMFTTINFNYSLSDLMEQGMIPQTNPMLTAFYRSPLLSVYQQDRFKNNLPSFNTIEPFGVSNPAAVVSDLNATSRSYDAILDIGLNYQYNSFWRFYVMGGLYYNYTKENIFIPGMSSNAIAPLMGGAALNTVRGSTGEGLNYYLKASINYIRQFNLLHDLTAIAGYQLMSSRKELDFGSGANTSSDFYQFLGNAVNYRVIDGYIDLWRWMNGYVSATYGYNHQFYVGGTLSMDGSSSYGKNTGRLFVFPTAKAAWKMHNSPFLRNNDFITNLTLRGEYGVNGNSRYSSKYGQNYYENIPMRTITGLVRAGLPNFKIKPERIITANVGVDASLFYNRLGLTLDFFQEKTKDMVLEREMGPAYGFYYFFDNAGEIRTRGVEFGFDVHVLNKGNFDWHIGGNISTYRSKVLSLGGPSSRILNGTDGFQLISQVGKAPNLFWGYKTKGVIASKQDAYNMALYTHGGDMFVAGDMIFEDLDNNKVIDEKDMSVLGNPAPDFYGGFYTRLAYKNFSLNAHFAYSYGNKIYNAVRRGNESMSTYYNQTRVVERRWTSDGQITDIPRAVYGDPNGNSRFSDRWVEDGSYLKLKELTLNYEIDRKVWIFRKLSAYVTGENLFTVTKYLGLDPEFAYNYDPAYWGLDIGKIPVAKSVKLGLILNF